MRILKFNRFSWTTAIAFLMLATGECHFSLSCAGEETGAPIVAPEQVRLAQKLVGALNADSYLVREKARESLLKLGRASIEPLESATKAEDSETRLRAIELLIALRGRGLLGVAMMQPNFGDVGPAWGAGVKQVPQGLPADQAGIQVGDTIIALNGAPVSGNEELQHLVFTSGPAKVMDGIVDRGGEKYHFPVLLTLNLNPPANRMVLPPVNLESELPASDNVAARAEAREKALQQTTFGNGIIVQGNGGVVQYSDTRPQPVQPPAIHVNAKEIENEFESVKAEAEKSSANENAPVGK